MKLRRSRASVAEQEGGGGRVDLEPRAARDAAPIGGRERRTPCTGQTDISALTVESQFI